MTILVKVQQMMGEIDFSKCSVGEHQPSTLTCFFVVFEMHCVRKVRHISRRDICKLENFFNFFVPQVPPFTFKL